MIDALVGLRALGVAVDDEHLAEDRRAHDGDLLILGSLRDEELVDGMMVLLGRRELFDVPLPMLRLRHEERRLAAQKEEPRRAAGFSSITDDASHSN